MFTNAFRRSSTVLASAAQKQKRAFGNHTPKVRPATRPADFEGFMRYYLVEDYQVVFFVLGAWGGVVMLGKGVAALFSSPKPSAAAIKAAKAHHASHAAPSSGNKDEIPGDIDGFLAWMDADASNLDKALATI